MLLARHVKKKSERNQINKIRTEKEVTTDSVEIQWIIKIIKKNFMAIKWITWK